MPIASALRLAATAGSSDSRFEATLSTTDAAAFGTLILQDMQLHSGARHPLLRTVAEADAALLKVMLVDYARLSALVFEGQINGLERLLQRVPSAEQRRWVLSRMVESAGLAGRDANDQPQGELVQLRRISHLLDGTDGRALTAAIGTAFRAGRRALDGLYAADRPCVGLGVHLGETAAWPQLAQAFQTAVARAPWARPAVLEALASLAQNRVTAPETTDLITEIGADHMSKRRALIFGMNQAFDIIHGLWTVLLDHRPAAS